MLAPSAGRGDELGVSDGQRLGAREAGIGRPGGERDRDHRAADPGPQRGDEGERQDQARESEEDVGQRASARGRAMPPKYPATQPMTRPTGTTRTRPRPPCRGDAPAVDQTREDVAAELVGAEPVRGRWRLEPVGEVLRIGVGGRDQRGGERDEDQQHDRDQPAIASRLAAKRRQPR